MADPLEWHGYFEATKDSPVDQMLLKLEPHLPASGDAIDLGCGAGRGTLWLLQHGMRVTAVDASQEAIEIVRARVPSDAAVTFVHAPFQELSLDSYDIAVASYTLFFLPPGDFESFWQRLVAAIKPGGLFAGQFLGVNDEWAPRGYAVLTRAGAEAHLADFEVLSFDEEEKDGPTACDPNKHWHVFHILARKR